MGVGFKYGGDCYIVFCKVFWFDVCYFSFCFIGWMGVRLFFMLMENDLVFFGWVYGFVDCMCICKIFVFVCFVFVYDVVSFFG